MSHETVDETAETTRAPRRLRDLAARERLLAAVVLVVVLVPFIAAIARALADGWVPSGDEANIATRALDVFSRHPPLTGLPSTSAVYGTHVATDHPGPIEFYLLALPLRLLGRSVGPPLTAAAINAGCVLTVLWVFVRRLGTTAMAWAAVLLLAVIWSTGTALLIDTLSSNMTTYSLLCTVVVVWAVVDGDIRLLPLGVLVGSYAAEQHLAAGVVVLALAILVVVASVLRRRLGRGTASDAKGPVVVGAAVAAVCWLPVLVDEVTGHPGNLSAIVNLARHGDVPSVGLAAGFHQAVHAIAFPTVLWQQGTTTGTALLAAPSALGAACAVLIGVVLVLIAWRERTRTPSLAALALTAVVLLVAGIVNGSKVPNSFESGRVNLYRWTWAAAFTVWGTLGLAVGVIAHRRGAARIVARLVPRVVSRRGAGLGAIALVVVAAFVSVSAATGAARSHDAVRITFRADRRLASATLAAVDRRHPVVVIATGDAANLAIAPALLFRLAEAGLRVEVPPFDVPVLGKARAFRANSGASAIVVVSGGAKLPAPIGRLLATVRFDPERSALLDELARDATGRPLVLAPNAAALLARHYSPVARIAVQRELAQLPTNPRAMLVRPEILALYAAGAIRSPALDPAKIRRLEQLPAQLGTFAGDEQVAVRLVSPEETRSPVFAKLLAAPPPLL